MRQVPGEADMDFSLQHFVRSTIAPPVPLSDPYMEMQAMAYYPQVQREPQQWCVQSYSQDTTMWYHNSSMYRGPV